jgi:hypothetical protein
MSLALLTSRDAVEAAMDELDQLGLDLRCMDFARAQPFCGRIGPQSRAATLGANAAAERLRLGDPPGLSSDIG